jgi:hypothetical protein
MLLQILFSKKTFITFLAFFLKIIIEGIFSTIIPFSKNGENSPPNFFNHCLAFLVGFLTIKIVVLKIM